ncbi:MAG: hypothetical protein ACK40L_19190 [Hydrogenophaga sp.]
MMDHLPSGFAALSPPRWVVAWGLGAAALLSGCGLESAGTAAAAGATKQAELEQARKAQEQVQQQLQQSMDLMNRRNQSLDENKP